MQYMNFFDDVYYINLDYRIDRRELFEKRASEVGIVANRFSGISLSEDELPQKWKDYYETIHDRGTHHWHMSKKRKIAEVSCAYSHVGVIKEAKERNLKNVLVFEDDCVFLDSWKNNIETFLNEIRLLNNDWDMIYFGGGIPGPLTATSTHLVECPGGIYCTHAYAINERYFYKILNYDPDFCVQIDVLLVNSSAKTYLPTDIMVVQQGNIISDITSNLTSSENEDIQIKLWKQNIITI